MTEQMMVGLIIGFVVGGAFVAFALAIVLGGRVSAVLDNTYRAPVEGGR